MASRDTRPVLILVSTLTGGSTENFMVLRGGKFEAVRWETWLGAGNDYRRACRQQHDSQIAGPVQLIDLRPNEWVHYVIRHVPEDKRLTR